ncbi:MAG TPA: aminoglycoside phosphotransferase family protein [Anaerolineae bacterium]|nr:aminoglycoside phosphotransferase family protein [Anaerolineae bacterium]
MRDENKLEISILKELVLNFLDADPLTLKLTPVRTGKHNTSYWIASNLGRFILRIAPRDDSGLLFYEFKMMRQEPDLHALIRAKTHIPAPAIIGYDFSRLKFNRDYLLMEVLPGVPVNSAYWMTNALVQNTLRQVGGYLRELHSLTATEHLGQTAYGYLGAHHPMAPQPTWGEAFHIMWNQLLDDVMACGVYTRNEAQVFRDLLDYYRRVFDHPLSPCLLHMDVWNQNILVDKNGNVTGLLDFDRALWGDVELEFAVLDYCGISEPAFWEGYGLPRDTSTEAQIRRQFYLLYEVQKYMPICVWRTHNPQDTEEYKEYSFILAAELLP